MYGIVKQSRGYVALDSEQGAGSTFTLFLPRVAGALLPDEAASRPSAPRRTAECQETILIVDDEPTLRQLAQRSLEQAGYKVIAAGNGIEALERIDSFVVGIDLLITDLVMPGMGGRELVERLNTRGTPFNVLFMSGYTDDEVMRRGLLDPGCAFLPKPFGLDTFMAKVREGLDAPCRMQTTSDGRAA